MNEPKPRSIPRESLRKGLAYALIALLLLETLGVASFTLYQVVEASTSVPWWDQWVFVRELQSHRHGAALWPILWSPYWGHRLVIPRLLFLADARWGSLGSLTWVTLVIQFAHIALLLGLAWIFVGRHSRAAFVLLAAVILNQLLSAFQVINFTWSMQTMFPLVYFAATVSFVAMSWGNGWPSLILSLAAGLISSYTMPNGLLVWPVLGGVAVFLKLSRSRLVVLAVSGIVVITTYFWHYQRGPAMGMGVAGLLRDPLHGLLLLGFVLGGPLDLVSRRIAPVAVLGALILVVWLTAVSIHRFPTHRRSFAALIAILIFTVLSALSMVAGRLDRRWLNGDLMLASRYYTVSGIFWAALALFVVYTCWQQSRRPWCLGFFAILFFGVMFSRIQRQLIWAEDWADFFRGVDATGLALLLDVPDEAFLSVLWPAKGDREEWTAFLREHRLSIFSEPQRSWPGKRMTGLFRPAEPGRCIGGIETRMDLVGWQRVAGWAWDTRSHTAPRLICLTNASGQIIGMARGGLRHGYLPGFPLEPALAPNSHAQFRHSEWLGYVRGDAVAGYGVVDRGAAVCKVF